MKVRSFFPFSSEGVLSYFRLAAHRGLLPRSSPTLGRYFSGKFLERYSCRRGVKSGFFRPLERFTQYGHTIRQMAFITGQVAQYLPILISVLHFLLTSANVPLAAPLFPPSPSAKGPSISSSRLSIKPLRRRRAEGRGGDTNGTGVGFNNYKI